MIKKFGIAAACGVALYGIARFINDCVVVVSNSPVQFPFVMDAAIENSAVLDDGTELGEVGGAAAMGQVVGDVEGAETVDIGVEGSEEKSSELDREAPCL